MTKADLLNMGEIPTLLNAMTNILTWHSAGKRECQVKTLSAIARVKLRKLDYEVTRTPGADWPWTIKWNDD